MGAELASALADALRKFLGTLARISRQVFHETAGALFLLFAAAGAVGVWRECQSSSAPWLVGLAIGFTLMMVAFAALSFRAARRARE